MLDLPAEFLERLSDEVTQVALCWRVTRADGVALGFTSHDAPFVIDGLPYRPSRSFTPSRIDTRRALSVDTLEVQGILSDAAISAVDLDVGRYDDAYINVFLTDWGRPQLAQLPLRSGRLGDIRRADDVFNAELRGRKQDLQRPISGIFSPECRAELGDFKCRVALREFIAEGHVTAVSHQGEFSSDLSEADEYFHYGRLRFLTGPNAGLVREVKRDVGGVLTLVEPLPFAIEAGQLFEAEAGCDKRFVTCRDKFNNALNFRGEPYLPGVDAIFEYPSPNL